MKKVPFPAYIECCPEFLEYSLYIPLLVSLVVRWFVKVGDNIIVKILENFCFLMFRLYVPSNAVFIYGLTHFKFLEIPE